MKQNSKQEERSMPHVISLSDRRALSVSGVQDVDSFDETTIIIYTVQGELTVKGNDLHINRLNIESGDLTMEGTVESLTYTDVRERSGGFFGKLFR